MPSGAGREDLHLEVEAPLPSPPLPDDAFCCGDGDDEAVDDLPACMVIPSHHRRHSSFSYERLPEPLLRLSVLKLDGSSFEVQIARTASVGDLKVAIENIFLRSSKDSQSTISWFHVWGHFCLCYKDYKLTDDKASLRLFGIKDGDQLHFIRLVTVSYTPGKTRSRSHEAVFEQHRRSLPSPKVLDEDEDIKKTDRIATCSNSLADQQTYDDGENDALSDYAQRRASCGFPGWFSYSRTRTCRKVRSESQIYCSKASKRERSVGFKLAKWLFNKK